MCECGNCNLCYFFENGMSALPVLLEESQYKSPGILGELEADLGRLMISVTIMESLFSVAKNDKDRAAVKHQVQTELKMLKRRRWFKVKLLLEEMNIDPIAIR